MKMAGCTRRRERRLRSADTSPSNGEELATSARRSSHRPYTGTTRVVRSGKESFNQALADRIAQLRLKDALSVLVVAYKSKFGQSRGAIEA